jgi:hypothetical protein
MLKTKNAIKNTTSQPAALNKRPQSATFHTPGVEF